MGQQEFSDIADGSYVGTNGKYWLVLRVDVDKPVDSAKIGAVSGDVQSTGPEDGAGNASFRSLDNLSRAALEEIIDVEWTDANGGHAHGSIWVRTALTAGSGDTVEVSLRAQDGVGGIPAGADIMIGCRRISSAMRELSVELAYEEELRPDGVDVTEVGSAPIADRLVQWWGRSGFALSTRTAETSIPHPEGGWAESDIFTELQNAMTRNAAGGLDRPNWDLNLLVLSATDRTGLEGVMFDLDGPRPRQGAAIFVDTIRAGERDQSLDRTILKTAIHELGHALNLRHRFDPEVRRSGSSSPMTYDWRYPGGPSKYWEKYGDGSFDPDELAFLRHAPRSQIIPGGAPFGSAVYWDDPPGIVTDPDEPWRSLSLWLTPPAAGTTFAYGQPVLLEASLLNTNAQSVRVHQHILDVKAGYLDVLISNADNDTRPGLVGARPFMPMMQRCFSVAGAQGFDLAYGESLHTNVNLTYGSGGSAFVEPGLYDLTPVLTFAAETSLGLDRLVVGPTLRIRVRAPRNKSEERDGDVLLGRSDVGISLALGGSSCFEAAAADLKELRDRRVRNAAGGPPDPVAVALARVTGIFEGRRGNVDEAAASLAEATTPEACRYFDPHTAEHTRRLAQSYDSKLPAAGPTPTDPTVVVLDLWTAPNGGWPFSGGRGSGHLTTWGAPSGRPTGSTPEDAWGVLAPASQLPAQAMDDDSTVAAVVTVTSGNGVTQRVTVSRIDLVSEVEGDSPTLALLELSHPVPGRFNQHVPAVDASSGQSESDIRSFFGGTDAYGVVGRTEQDLDAWTEAADLALNDRPRPSNPLTPVPAIVHSYRGIGLDQVAGWRCRILGICATADPPPDKHTRYYLPYRAEPRCPDPEPSEEPPKSQAGA